MDERIRAVAFVFKLSIKTWMRAVNRAAAVRFLRSKRTTPDASYLDESADGRDRPALGLGDPFTAAASWPFPSACSRGGWKIQLAIRPRCRCGEFEETVRVSIFPGDRPLELLRVR